MGMCFLLKGEEMKEEKCHKAPLGISFLGVKNGFEKALLGNGKNDEGSEPSFFINIWINCVELVVSTTESANIIYSLCLGYTGSLLST